MRWTIHSGHHLEVAATQEVATMIPIPVNNSLLVPITEQLTMSLVIISMKVVLSILFLIILTESLANVLTFSKALYIPGQYFSLMNFTYNVDKIDDYLDVDISYQLSQVKVYECR